MNKVPLSSVAKVLRGVTFSKSEGTTSPSDDRLPVIRAGSIQQHLLLDEGQIWVPASKIKPNQIIRENDIIMCTSSGSSDLVGKCAKSTQNWNGSFGAFCAGIRADESKCSSSYLYHFLCSPHFRNWTKSSSGANIKNIRASELAAFEIPLPPLEEQKRIAVILDKADAIRRKRQQAIDLTDQLLRSVFLDMFGDPVTNPKGWDKKPLNKYAKKITVGHVGPTSDYYTDSGVPFLRTQNVRRLFVNRNDMMQVTEAFHAKLKKSTLKADDVLVSRVGANRGMSCVVPEDLDGANCANILLATLNEKYDPYFLSYLINSEYGQRTLLGDSVGSAQGVINTAKLKDWLVYDVPVDLQKKFRNATMRLFEQKEKYKNSLELMNDNFASLSQRAFSGELTKATKAA